MLSTCNSDEEMEHRIEPWIGFLEEEMAHATDDDPVSYRLARVIRDALLSAGESQTAVSARRIHTCYQFEYMGSDPFLTSLDGGGASYLCTLYNLVFEVAKLMYREVPQDILVQLLVELDKLLPTRCSLLPDEDALVLTKNPIFAMVMENFRRKCRPRGARDNVPILEDACSDWINISAFIARCIRSGLLDGFENGCGYPLYDIPKGLQRDHPVKILQHCFVTVAAQYIILAGSKIHHHLVGAPGEGSDARERGLYKWLHWAERFNEVAESEGRGTELGFVAWEAGRKMLSLHYSDAATSTRH